MNRTCLLIATLSISLPLVAAAQTTEQTANIPTSIAGHEVHSLIKSAHTSAQYKQLASYFHQEEARYRAKAVEEKTERDRRAQVNAPLMQKYPRPVDSAQYLYETYSEDADHAVAQARHYDQLAAETETEHEGQLAATTQGKL